MLTFGPLSDTDTFSGAITAGSGNAGIAFAPLALPAGEQFVADITLFAELSGGNTPGRDPAGTETGLALHSARPP
jgi:hypothetical protein